MENLLANPRVLSVFSEDVNSLLLAREYDYVRLFFKDEICMIGWILPVFRVYSIGLSIMKVYINRVPFALPYVISRRD